MASLLIPRGKRPYVAAIYAYARLADDVADEGARSPEERLRLLDAWEAKLDACIAGDAEDPVFLALGETIARCSLPRRPLADLLKAFRMDVTRNRYETFADLLEYCRCSANPIGQLVLRIFRRANDHTISLSDSICTALQLTNFWQDVALDLQKGRIYVPLEDLERFGYTEDDLCRKVEDHRFRNVVEFQVERTRDLFETGKPLLSEVSGRLRFELWATYLGGMRILEKIREGGHSVLTHRPALTTGDKIMILAKAALQRES